MSAAFSHVCTSLSLMLDNGLCVELLACSASVYMVYFTLEVTWANHAKVYKSHLLQHPTNEKHWSANSRRTVHAQYRKLMGQAKSMNLLVISKLEARWESDTG